MPVTCAQCGKSYDPQQQVGVNPPVCPNCRTPFKPAAPTGAASPVSGDSNDLAFEDFFELTDKGKDVPPPPAAATVPPPPQAPPPPAPSVPAAPPVQRQNLGNIVEEVAESSMVEDSINDDLLGEFGSFEATNAEAPVAKAPAPPPPNTAPTAKQNPAANSLDSDFEDLFEDDFAPAAAKAQTPPAATKAKADTGFADPRREPDEVAASNNTLDTRQSTMKAAAAEADNSLEELFVEPVAGSSEPIAKADKESEADDGSFSDLIKEDHSSQPRRFYKNPWIIFPSISGVLVLSIVLYSFFAPKQMVPGFLQGIRRIYHGGPSNRERNAMIEQAEKIAEVLLVDRFDIYGKVISDLEAIIKRDPEQYLARGYYIISKSLVPFDLAPDKAEDKNVADNLKILQSLPPKNQPENFKLAQAFYQLELHQPDTAAPLLDALPKSALGNFARGEFAWQKKELEKAKAAFSSAPQFRRSQYRIAQLAEKNSQWAEARKIYHDLYSQDPPHLLSGVALLRLDVQEKGKNAEIAKAAADFLTTYQGKISNFEKSQLYFMQYNFDASSQDFIKKAYEADPANPHYAHLLGRSLLETDLEQSLVLIRKAVNLSSTNPIYQASLGEALRLKGELENSLKTLQDALTATPENLECMLELAKTWLVLGNADETKKTINKMLVAYPTNNAGKLILAQLYLKDNDSKDAIKLLKEVLSSAPQTIDAYTGLADALIQTNDSKQALATLQTGLNLAPQNSMILGRIAKVQALLGNKKEALEFSQKAIASDPNNKQLLLMSAETSRELKEYAKAEPSLKKLVTLDPKNIEYKLMLGRNYIDLEQGKEAEEVLQEALNLKSDDNLLHHYAGVAYRLMKNYEQALVEINKSILSNAEFKPNYYELALNYDAMSDYANAVKSLDTLFKLDPNHIRGTLLGAELYGKIGDYDKAVVFYKKILKSQPEDWRSRINLANNYLKLTQPNEAGKEFIQALKQNPKSSEGWIGLGKIYEDRNDHLKAVSYYIKARDLDPSNPEVYYRLGYVFKDVGNRAQARSAFKKFLELDPKTKFKSVVEDELTDLEGN